MKPNVMNRMVVPNPGAGVGAFLTVQWYGVDAQRLFERIGDALRTWAEDDPKGRRALKSRPGAAFTIADLAELPYTENPLKWLLEGRDIARLSIASFDRTNRAAEGVTSKTELMRLSDLC